MPLVYGLLIVSYMVVVTQIAIKEAAGEKTPTAGERALQPRLA